MDTLMQLLYSSPFLLTLLTTPNIGARQLFGLSLPTYETSKHYCAFPFVWGRSKVYASEKVFHFFLRLSQVQTKSLDLHRKTWNHTYSVCGTCGNLVEFSDDNAVVESSRTPRWFLQRVTSIILVVWGRIDRRSFVHTYIPFALLWTLDTTKWLRL